MRVLMVSRDDPRGSLTGVGAYLRDLTGEMAGVGIEATPLSTRSLLQQSRLDANYSTPGRVRADASNPALQRALEQAILEARPDLVHVHDTMGIPASFVPWARGRGLPVVITLHDFWPFCHRLFLLRPGFAPCEGSGGGYNCAIFCSSQGGMRRLWQAADQSLPLGLSVPLRWALRLRRKALGSSRTSQFAPGPALPRPVKADPILAEAYAAREAALRDALLQADIVLAVSAFVKSSYVRHGYSSDRIRILRIATKSVEHITRRPHVFQKYPVRFGFLGRITPLKGAHLLASAIAGVAPESAEVIFYGPAQDSDRGYLLGLAGHRPGVHFRGRYAHDQLDGILQELDVVVFPSLAPETQGLVGLEAQAGGVPVIAADHGAVPEYIRDGVNGLLFAPGDAASLRTQILRIVEEPGLIAALSANARSPVPMHTHARQVLAVYEETFRTDRVEVTRA